MVDTTDNIMKYVYVIIDSELGESDSFMGVFDSKDYAIHTAKVREQVLFNRDVYRVKINQFGLGLGNVPIFSTTTQEIC